MCADLSKFVVVASEARSIPICHYGRFCTLPAGKNSAMSVLPSYDRSLGRTGHVTSTAQLSPGRNRGLFGSDMSRPQSVQWSLRTGPASPRSVAMTPFSPRTTSFVDQSFHRVANKFSPVAQHDAPRNPYLARSYDHQRWCWQASRLSVVTPTSWHRPTRTPFGPYAHPGSSTAATWAFAHRPASVASGDQSAYSSSGMWPPPPPPPKTSRTIDFWQ